MINLDLLRVFSAVSRSESLKMASEKLSVTPSAITQSVNKLEKQLGFQLFLRSHKKVTLNHRGVELKEKLIPHLSSIENIIEEVSLEANKKTPQGKLIIGAPFELGSTELVKIFSNFQKKNPLIRARLLFGSPLGLLEKLRLGQIDFCLAADGAHFDNLSDDFLKKEVFNEDFGFFAHTDLVPRNKRKNYDFLASLPHLDYLADGSVVKKWYQHSFNFLPKHLDIVLSAESALPLLEGVKNGLGLALLPKNRLKGKLPKDVIEIKVVKNSIVNPIVLIQHQSTVPTVKEKIFIKFLIKNKFAFD